MQFVAKEHLKKGPLLSIPSLDHLPYTRLELRKSIEALAYHTVAGHLVETLMKISNPISS